MSFVEKILRMLDAQMARPELFGWFHLMWIALVILGSVGLCTIHKNKSMSVPKVLMVVSVAVAVLELYKQVNYSFSYGNGIRYDYQWYAFPFQFCSTPMYVGLLAGIFKKGKFHDALCAYLATFSVFAGVCVTVYPGDVFVGTVGINIQTMICHGSMIVLGVYLFYTGHVKAELRTVLKAIPVFAACVGLAAAMNEIAHLTGLLERETFNMFFISPYCAPSLPVYSQVQNALPFPWCLVVYILAFTLASTIILLIAIGIFGSLSRKRIKV